MPDKLSLYLYPIEQCLSFIDRSSACEYQLKVPLLASKKYNFNAILERLIA